MTKRRAYRVLWADRRAVQYFWSEADADDFYADYKKADAEPPEFVDVPKGVRVQKEYRGPHPSIAKLCKEEAK